MGDFELDRDLVDAFADGRLDPAGEAVLANQVARVLPAHWVAPNPIAAELSRIIDRVGGDAALFEWLARHPGYPRLVARHYGLIGLLDRISDQPAVIDALRELRRRVPYPPGLAGYLVPDTNETTLSSLGETIEALLLDDRRDEAVRVAVATIAMLQSAVWGHEHLHELRRQLDERRGEIAAAANEAG